MEAIAPKNATQREVVQQVYFEICTIAAEMNMQLNYQQKAELPATFRQFRRKMIELYYLVRFSKDFEGNILLERVDKWRKINCCNVRDLQFYADSLKLFDEFTAGLAKKNII